MERWTRWMIRYRWPVVAGWLVVLVVGGWSATKLSALLSNEFTMPGTDSERARSILKEHYNDRSDGAFTIVFRVPDSRDPQQRLRLQRRMASAAELVPSGRAQPLVPGGPHVLYGDITSTLALAKAKGFTDDLLARLPQGGGVRSYVTGQAAIQHDLDPIFDEDLRKGEFQIAIPIALAVLLLVFGLSWSVTIPLLFAACTIEATLGLVYAFAHHVTMATYVTNLVQLIGLGIAIDYSLLIVYRFREELARGGPKDDAVVRTMATAGRAVVFSGATVAIGLALLLFMPSPFIRSMGIGGFLIPLVSIAGAVTLQPALLSIYGRRGTKRVRVWRFGEEGPRRGFWERLSAAIMKRPLAFLAGGAVLLVASALPVFALKLTPGSAQGIPQHPQAVRGFALLKDAVGAGALSPTQIIVDTGRADGVASPDVQRGISTLVERIRRNPEVAFVRYRAGPPLVDPTGRYAEIVVAGKHEYGEGPAQRFVHELRGEIVPSVSWPRGTTVLAGGGPPQGVDFIQRSYAVFPWLVLGVLVLTYLLLLRAFRSLLLPLKAVILNLLSVAAAYGLLVVVFKWGIGNDVLGLYQFPQIEAWIPIFLFAMLFGLSMDYEVFLVTRMREAWDETHDNVRAVGLGLERTGRIVSAAAIIMVAAFCGFVAGRIVGLQEFGLGLAVAILFDATIVRVLLVPSLMAIFGRWNWWLPGRVARVVRVPPSPLETPAPALRPAGR
ncbi:MAG TPA: MMPL family transporter [Gaiellaceae bacterium]|nr:MMPL family transporter [Gaiellaceae bacterium]